MLRRQSEIVSGYPTSSGPLLVYGRGSGKRCQRIAITPATITASPPQRTGFAYGILLLDFIAAAFEVVPTDRRYLARECHRATVSRSLSAIGCSRRLPHLA